MAEVILGGLLLAALMGNRARGVVSQAAYTQLGAVTDTEYLTLTPSLVGLMEITNVEVKADPVVGDYAKVWVTLKCNETPGLAGVFCRIYDDDTGILIGEKKDWYAVFAGQTWIAKYDAWDDWNYTMPDRVWNLRIETGIN